MPSPADAVAVGTTLVVRRPDHLDLFDPSNAALLLSLTSKKHRQGLLSRHGTGGGRSISIGSSTSSSFASPTSFAHKQLSKLGWTPGAALGRDHGKDGRTHQRTAFSLRRDGDESGLGHSNNNSPGHGGGAPPPAAEWWKDALGSTLARLGSNKGSVSSKKDGSKKQRKDKRKEKTQDKKRKRRGEESDSDDPPDAKNGAAAQPQPPPMVRHYTDEELFARTGGSRFGMRASPKAIKLDKWRRTKDELCCVLVGDPGTGPCGECGAGAEEDGAAEGAPPTLSSSPAAKDGAKSRKSKKRRREQEPPVAAAPQGPPSTTSASENGDESWRGNRAAKKEKKGKKKKSRDDEEATRSKQKKRKGEAKD